MSMPTRPIPHFILIQAGLPFPFFQTFLDLPPGSRHFRHSIEWGIDRVGYRSSGVSIEWGIDRGVREVVSEFYRFRERPPSDEPPFFTGQTVPLLDHSAARPIVEAKTLLAFRDGKPFPLLRGLARHHGFHRFRWGGLRA